MTGIHFFFLRTKSIRMLENPKKTKNIAKKIERPHLGFKKKFLTVKANALKLRTTKIYYNNVYYKY